MPSTAFLLQDAGFDRKQVEALTEFMSSSVATKEDIAHLEGKIDTTAMQLRGELKIDIERLESKVEAQGVKLNGKINLLYWMFSILLTGVASLVIKAFFSGSPVIPS